MAAWVDLCNLALMRVGVTAAIASLSESSKEAKICNRLYERVRDYVLRDFPWNFATRRVALALTGTAPTNWEYQYAYPSDCLLVRGLVLEGMRIGSTEYRIPWEVGTDGTYKVIWTNQPDAEAVYTMRIDDPTLFDAQFESAFAWALGAELVMPLSIKPELAQMCQRSYAQVVHQAAAASANEAWAGVEPTFELLNVRGFNG